MFASGDDYYWPDETYFGAGWYHVRRLGVDRDDPRNNPPPRTDDRLGDHVQRRRQFCQRLSPGLRGRLQSLGA